MQTNKTIDNTQNVMQVTIPAEIQNQYAMLKNIAKQNFLIGGTVFDLIVDQFGEQHPKDSKKQVKQSLDLDLVSVHADEDALIKNNFWKSKREELSVQLYTFRSGYDLDLTVINNPDIKAGMSFDISQRDFKLCCVYIDADTGIVYDPTGKGVDDILNNRISAVGDPKELFDEHPESLLRAIKYLVIRHSTIEENTEKAIIAWQWDDAKTDITRLRAVALKHLNNLDAKGKVEGNFEKTETYVQLLGEKGLLEKLFGIKPTGKLEVDAFNLRSALLTHPSKPTSALHALYKKKKPVVAAAVNETQPKFFELIPAVLPVTINKNAEVQQAEVTAKIEAVKREEEQRLAEEAKRKEEQKRVEEQKQAELAKQIKREEKKQRIMIAKAKEREEKQAALEAKKAEEQQLLTAQKQDKEAAKELNLEKASVKQTTKSARAAKQETSAVVEKSKVKINNENQNQEKEQKEKELQEKEQKEKDKKKKKKAKSKAKSKEKAEQALLKSSISTKKDPQDLDEEDAIIVDLGVSTDTKFQPLNLQLIPCSGVASCVILFGYKNNPKNYKKLEDIMESIARCYHDMYAHVVDLEVMMRDAGLPTLWKEMVSTTFILGKGMKVTGNFVEFEGYITSLILANQPEYILKYMFNNSMLSYHETQINLFSFKKREVIRCLNTLTASGIPLSIDNDRSIDTKLFYFDHEKNLAECLNYLINLFFNVKVQDLDKVKEEKAKLRAKGKTEDEIRILEEAKYDAKDKEFVDFCKIIFPNDLSYELPTVNNNNNTAPKNTEKNQQNKITKANDSVANQKATQSKKQPTRFDPTLFAPPVPGVVTNHLNLTLTDTPFSVNELDNLTKSLFTDNLTISLLTRPNADDTAQEQPTVPRKD